MKVCPPPLNDSFLERENIHAITTTLLKFFASFPVNTGAFMLGTAGCSTVLWALGRFQGKNMD